VTLKIQTRDPNALKARYLEIGWRQRLRSKVPPIENGLCGIEWSRDRCRHMTLKGQTRDPNTLRPSVCKSVTRVDQSKTANVRIMTF